jgi:hypothetical protein
MAATDVQTPRMNESTNLIGIFNLSWLEELLQGVSMGMF